MNTDPIADMLTRLRNAERAGHKNLRMPYSKVKENILKVMVSNGFISSVNIDKTEKFPELSVELADRPHKMEIKRVSKPGQRIYVKSSEIPAVMNGLGIAILSTPKGVMSDAEARKNNVGGEIICRVF